MILLVNMPFSGLRPSLGLSLLEATARNAGCECRIEYANLRFAKRIGQDLYSKVAEKMPPQLLVGDFLFSGCVFSSKTDPEPWMRMARARFPKLFHAEFCEELRRVRSVAATFIQELADEYIKQSHTIGFSSTFSQHVAAIALAMEIKRRDETITIVFGGANCEAGMGLATHKCFTCIDFICCGEADVSFVQLLQQLRFRQTYQTVPGVIDRRGGCSHFSSLTPDKIASLDLLPIPEYSEFFSQSERLGIISRNRDAPFESSRGCWWGEKQHCTFCGLNGLSMSYRSKSATRVLKEIRELTTNYKLDELTAVDNILDLRYFRDLIPELKAMGAEVAMFYETKANLSRERVRELREAGIILIQPGIESLSTAVLRLMRKGTTALQNVQLLKWCREFGVKPLWNVLYGFPGEAQEDYEVSAEIMTAIHHLPPPTGAVEVRLDRFSPMFNSPLNFGLCRVRPDQAYSLIYDLSQHDLSNLAYYFEFDYQKDRRDLNPAVLTDAVSSWVTDSRTQGVFTNDDKNSLLIVDLRQGAADPFMELRGPEREVYLYCDQVRSEAQLRDFGNSRGLATADLQMFLSDLKSRRLLVSSGADYLAVAVASSYNPQASEGDWTGDTSTSPILSALEGERHA